MGGVGVWVSRRLSFLQVFGSQVWGGVCGYGGCGGGVRAHSTPQPKNITLTYMVAIGQPGLVLTVMSLI